MHAMHWSKTPMENPRMNRSRQVFCTFVALLAFGGFANAADNAVKLTDTVNKVTSDIVCKTVSEHLDTAEKEMLWPPPYFYEVKGTDGVEITSDQARSNPKGHPHQRSIWVANGADNGDDHCSDGKI